jgi:hypothetical protein
LSNFINDYRETKNNIKQLLEIWSKQYLTTSL